MAALDIAADKQKALNIAIGQIEKAHGKGSIMRMGAGERTPIEAISTGAINLDAAIGARTSSPRRITDPLPNCRSICARAVSSALSRSAEAICSTLSLG